MVIKTTRKTTRILPELLIEVILNLIAYSRWAFSVLLTDGGGAKKAPQPNICHAYPTMMKLGKVIHCLNKIQKAFKSRDTPLDFC